MSSSDRGSVSIWLDELREGDSVAAQELWNRYFARLAMVAQARLRTLARDSSGEDIALSAMKSVMIGVRENRFPDLADRDGLWPLLVTITARKSLSEQRRQLAQKRTRALEEQLPELSDIIGLVPTPEFAAEVADEIERLVKLVGDATLRQVVERKLGGYTNEEIAEELGCTKRTVIRKLKRIRQEWRSATCENGESSQEP
jgi:RNA polymerase sigma factor (sigma-70 family)